jgi:hypothetical protein
MSTQRRANRTSPAINTDCAGVWLRWFRGCMEHAGTSVSAAQTGSELASVLTAPLMSITWLAWAWFSIPATTSRRGPRWLRICDEGSQTSTFRVATNSLPSDTCFETIAGLGRLSGSPPRQGAGDRRRAVRRATHMSSALLFPSSPSAPVSRPPCRKPQQA